MRGQVGVPVVLLCAALGLAGCKKDDAAASAAASGETSRWKKLASKDDGSAVLMDTESITTEGRPTAWFRRVDEFGKLKREWRLRFTCDKREYQWVEKYVANDDGKMQKAEVGGDPKSVKPESYQEEAFGLLCVKKKL